MRIIAFITDAPTVRDILERLPGGSALRESLFDKVGPFLTIRPRDGPLSRTFVRGLPSRALYHRSSLLRAVDAPARIVKCNA